MFPKMNIYLLIALLPCIWVADSKDILCPDGTKCPFGKTCCESPNQSFHCCDLVEEERYNKKLVSAFLPLVSRNDTFQTCNETCNGTMCSSAFCCDYKFASCCTASSCCPNRYTCCGIDKVWCCKTNQRCANSYLYCVAGAASLSPGFIAMILTFILVMASKRF